VRPAWEITENDPDLIGLKADDKIIIPDNVSDPPGLRTLERIRKRREHAKDEPERPQPQKKTGRNDPCPCGSGKKFKKCHG